MQEPQRQLAAYYQAMLAQQMPDSSTIGESSGSNRLSASYKPPSPKLLPLGSPGIVTPLELEGDGYLSAGVSGSQKERFSVDTYIQKEATRRGDASPRHRTAV